MKRPILSTSRRISFLGATLLLLTSAAGTVYAGTVETIPPAPTVLPDMHNVEVVHNDDLQKDVYVFTNPYIPPLTQSNDLRIGLVRKRAGNTNDQAIFHLLVPEQLGDELMLAGAGAKILDETPYEVDAEDFHSAGPNVGDATHFVICDPREGATQNPYVCSTDNDCYDLTVVTAVQLGGDPTQIQLWSTPVTVEVEKPKSAQANIFSVTPGTPIGGPALPTDPEPNTIGMDEFHSPMIVGDNRLLAVRFGRADLEWHDNSCPQGDDSCSHKGTYNAAYSYYSGGNECDISGWTEFRPLAFAPEDEDLEDAQGNKRFGFTEYPYRTPSGAAINSDPAVAPLEDFGFGYLWIDQAADHLFFPSLSRKLIDGTAGCENDPTCAHLYNLSCVSGTGCSDPYDPNAETVTAPHEGWMTMGLWTHGKMVLLDSLVNHTDWNLEGEEHFHRDVELFSTGSDVRVGAGRDAGLIRIGNDPETDPYGWVRTTVQFGSLENFLNMVPEMRPRTPRDVVWQITAGGRTDEIAFDDYASFKTLIFSPMNALKEMVVSPRAYYDGNDQTYDEMRLQNAATTLKWNPPSYGEVVLPSTSPETKGRIENVALGGIKARGFHLNPETGIEYVIPSQPVGAPTMTAQEWMISLFLDRTDASWGELRPIVTFPSGAEINLFGLTQIKVCGTSGGGCPSVKLPKPITTRGWSHFTFLLDPGDEKIRFFQDGFLFAELDLPAGMEIEPGTLMVGSPDGGTTEGVGGWIDEFKVVEGPFTYEEVCNHARGTLVAVPSSYATTTGVHLADLLDPFNDAETHPDALSGRAAVHEALYGSSAQVTSNSDYYVCNIDYTSPEGISVHDPGDANARSIRFAELMPEGTVNWDQFRPDSTNNSFCLSCHRDEEKGGLTLAALELDTTDPAEDDPRRQPLQAPAMMLGHVPVDYFGIGKPAAAEEAPKIDRWIHDDALYHWPFDEAAGTTVRNWSIGDPEATATSGTLHGAAFRAGQSRGHALEFDGGVGGLGGTADGSDYLRIDHNLDVQGSGLTLAAWIRLGVDGISHTPEDRCQNFVSATPCTIIAKSTDDGSNHGVDWSLRVFYRVNDPEPAWRAELQVRIDGDPNVKKLSEVLVDPTTQSPDDFDSTAWHHLAATFDGVTMKLFLDGDFVGQKNVGSQSSELSTDPNHPVTLGSKLSTGGAPLHPFFGLLDDVRIYSRALLDWEIQALPDHTP